MQRELIEMQLVRKAAPHLQMLDNEGFQLYAPTDFREIPDLVAQTGRAAQSPMMSLSRNDFTQGNAFWLFLMVDGVCVGGCAAHLIDLRDEPFEAYLRRSSQALYGRDEDPIDSIARPVCTEIKGKLIYFGELEIHRQYRGRIKALAAFTRIIQALAVMKWPDFDWMYAYVPFEHVKLTGIYGFTWQMPYAIRWKKPVPPGRLDNHWMIALPRSHFNQVWSCDA
jgi:hypothetical protein